MAGGTCAHCGTPIAEPATATMVNGPTYCCNKLPACGRRGPRDGRTGGGATCAHCGAPMIDATTQVERDGAVYCYASCAVAMTAGVEHRI